MVITQRVRLPLVGVERGNIEIKEALKKLRGLCPQANYTDRDTDTCRRS
jgi:hypothetical protein